MNAKGEATAAYMREYYRAHSTHTPMIPGATRASKKCRQCGIEKPRSDYAVRQSGPQRGHLLSYCKPCLVIRSRLAKEQDGTIYRRIIWPSKLRTLYGITVDDYHALLVKQGGGCALCGTTDPNVGNRLYKKQKRTVFDVDHDHQTGVVRGLLCTRCNRLVGLANDSLETARKLVDYLSKGV